MSTTVLITHDLGAGGVQRKIADVARYLMTGGMSDESTIHLLLEEGPPSEASERALFDVVAASTIRIRCRARPNASFAVPFPLFCFWHVLRLRPDRIIGLLRGPGILAVMLRRLFWWRAIRVGISDDSFPSGSIAEQTRGATHAALLAWLVRVGYGHADWVAAPSEAARTDLIEAFSVPADRVIVSRNWVSAAVPAGDPVSETRASTMVAAGMPNGGFDMIYVGRLAPVKNLALFVEVVRGVRELYPAVRAAIVGGGPQLADLERQRARLALEDHLVLAGWQRDVTPWLAASRLFCLTSHHEGLPIAALEAMALGVPVIASRYPGVDEIVRDGETGFICGDRGELVERIVSCLTHEPLRQELGRRARELVRGRYGADNLGAFVELIVRG
jgi:glycosyltransferase involved in cell wall biosynthesis